MKCKFCHNNLLFSHKEEKNSVFECHFCEVYIFFYFDEKFNITKTIFLLDKNQKNYYVVQNLEQKSTYIILCDHLINKNSKLINVPQIIDLTPENVYEKFNFYLSFS